MSVGPSNKLPERITMAKRKTARMSVEVTVSGDEGEDGIQAKFNNMVGALEDAGHSIIHQSFSCDYYNREDDAPPPIY